MKKEARVHRLSTEDSMSSPFYVDKHNNIYEWGEDLKASGTPQHLYITTDEKIKEGDWYLWGGAEQKNIYQCKVSEAGDLDKLNTECKSLAKKIIATTDPKLHTNEIVEEDMHMYKKSLPQIPQSFIEEYCKAGGIDEVLVEYELKMEVTSYSKSGCGNFKPLSTGKPKLNPDNTIIIHPVEEKMYSREEVVELVKKLKGQLIWDIDKWIEENL